MNHKAFSIRHASLQIDLLSDYKKAVEGCLCNSPSFVLACYHARGQCQVRARGLASKKSFLLFASFPSGSGYSPKKLFFCFSLHSLSGVAFRSKNSFFLLFASLPIGSGFSLLLFIPTFIRHIAGSLPRVLLTA